MSIQRSFADVDKEFAPMMWRIALSYEADRGLAEDLLQDIRVALWRALISFRGESSLRTFVARVATNRAISHLRKQVRDVGQVELSDDLRGSDATPESTAIALDQEAKLLSAVGSLPLSLRQVALLTLEGLKPAEIAEVLGITANAVTVRIFRAKDTLRNLLGEV